MVLAEVHVSMFTFALFRVTKARRSDHWIVLGFWRWQNAMASDRSQVKRQITLVEIGSSYFSRFIKLHALMYNKCSNLHRVSSQVNNGLSHELYPLQNLCRHGPILTVEQRVFHHF